MLIKNFITYLHYKITTVLKKKKAQFKFPKPRLSDLVDLGWVPGNYIAKITIVSVLMKVMGRHQCRILSS